MEYTLITIISIVSATILVHQLANRLLDVQISIKPLALCALCSLFLSLVLPRFIVSFTGLAGTIGVLAVFAIIFAYFIVYYEDMQIKEKADQNILHEIKAIGLVPSISSSIIDNSTEFKVQTETVADSKITDSDKTTDNSISEQSIDGATSIQPSDECQSKNHDDMEYGYEKEPVPLNLISHEILQQINNKHDDIVTDESMSDTNADIQTCEEDQCQKHNNMEHNCNKESIISKHDEESLKATFVHSTDLDELLDYAFSQKNAKSFPQAMAAFRQIMSLYPDNSSASFAAIEIGNMLKNNGEYDQAIRVFTEAISLPANQDDAGLQQEFESAAEYVRTIKKVLLEHQLGDLPFNVIPHEILQQIDNEHRSSRR